MKWFELVMKFFPMLMDFILDILKAAGKGDEEAKALVNDAAIDSLAKCEQYLAECKAKYGVKA